MGSCFDSTLASTAGALANAATRSAIEGSSFGDNITRALPDAIANTIGNLAAEALAGNGRSGGSGRSGTTQGGNGTDSASAAAPGTAGTSVQGTSASGTDAGGTIPGEPIVVIGDPMLHRLLISPWISNEDFRSRYQSHESGNLVQDTILAGKIIASNQAAYASSITRGYSLSSYKPGVLASMVQMAFPDAHSIGVGASADVALGAGVHLGGAYRYDLDTGAHGGTLDWGAGIGAAFSVGGGPFVSKESFNPNIPMSVDIGSNIGIEVGPISAEAAYKWQAREGLTVVRNGEPWERSFSVVGYDLLGSRSALEEKYSASYNASHGSLNVESSHAIPSISRDSFMSLGGKAYLFNLSVQNIF